MAGQLNTVADVMDAYTELLEKHSMAIMDVTTLPLPKTQMKVILKSLYAEAETRDQQNLIEAGFVFLSKFQQGVGPKPIEGIIIDDNPPTRADILKLDKWMAWEKLSLAEADILKAEWKRYLAGEPI